MDVITKPSSPAYYGILNVVFIFKLGVNKQKILQPLGPPKHQIYSENSYVPQLYHSKCEYLNTQVKVYVF